MEDTDKISKKKKFKENLEIGVAVFTIFGLTLAAVVNYYTLKRIAK